MDRKDSCSKIQTLFLVQLPVDFFCMLIFFFIYKEIWLYLPVLNKYTHYLLTKNKTIQNILTSLPPTCLILRESGLVSCLSSISLSFAMYNPHNALMRHIFKFFHLIHLQPNEKIYSCVAHPQSDLLFLETSKGIIYFYSKEKNKAGIFFQNSIVYDPLMKAKEIKNRLFMNFHYPNLYFFTLNKIDNLKKNYQHFMVRYNIQNKVRKEFLIHFPSELNFYFATLLDCHTLCICPKFLFLNNDLYSITTWNECLQNVNNFISLKCKSYDPTLQCYRTLKFYQHTDNYWYIVERLGKGLRFTRCISDHQKSRWTYHVLFPSPLDKDFTDSDFVILDHTLSIAVSPKFTSENISYVIK